jgi:hypothetical protein
VFNGDDGHVTLAVSEMTIITTRVMNVKTAFFTCPRYAIILARIFSQQRRHIGGVGRPFVFFRATTSFRDGHNVSV